MEEESEWIPFVGGPFDGMRLPPPYKLKIEGVVTRSRRVYGHLTVYPTKVETYILKSRLPDKSNNWTGGLYYDYVKKANKK